MLPCSVPKRKIAVRNETDGAITRTAVTIERVHPPYRMSFDHRISDPQERAAFKRAEHSFLPLDAVLVDRLLSILKTEGMAGHGMLSIFVIDRSAFCADPPNARLRYQAT